MIRWCSYCQKFQGEVAPFENKVFSHGICKSCAKIGLKDLEKEDRRIQYLADLNRRFYRAGRSGDPSKLKELVEEGIRAGIRPIDILYGIAAPLLARVGDLWQANRLGVSDEHAFIRACESVVEMVSDLIHGTKDFSEERPTVLLANVEANRHELGLRFAALGLVQHGVHSEILRASSDEEIVERAIAGNFRVVGLSVALVSQVENLNRLLKRLSGDPRFQGRIVVGGPAINEGLVPEFTAPTIKVLARPKFDEEDIELFR